MSDHPATSTPTPDLAALPMFADQKPANTPPSTDVHPRPAVASSAAHSLAPHRALAEASGSGVRPHESNDGFTVLAPTTSGRFGRLAPTAREASAGIDWGLVRAFRQQAAEQLSARLQDRDGLDTIEQHELGRSIVLDMLSDHANEAMHTGTPTFTPDEQQQLAAAIFNSLFGLGRLQPLVDNPDVENIEIYGHDNVLLEFSDGRLEEGPPVADSDAELIEALAFLGSRSQSNERPFSPATADLHLRLDGGARLAATAWVTPRPAAVIRRHRLRVVTLDDLVDRGMFDAGMATFLAAAVHAKKSMVISGAQGAGKALALDTPVPTPTGFTTMGALRAGDQVFDEQGRPCNVRAAHEVLHDRACYEVLFDDGSTITADADHLWRVTRRWDRERQTRTPRAPAFYVSAEERARLHGLAEEASESPDRDVTVVELVAEVGEQHSALLYEEARKVGPVGHVRVSWVGAYGATAGRDIRTYSREQLLKNLAARRETPRPHQRSGPDSVVLTTAEMAADGLWAHPNRSWRTHNFAVDLAAPLEYPSQEQFIDPYVLGIWLGDGATAAARVSTADCEVLTELERAGYPCTRVGKSPYDYQVGGSLQVQLRTAGVLGDKHIPREYRYGDVGQRVNLLHGLMDSDGTCTSAGACEYTSTLSILADQVYELVCGLGYRAHRRSKAVTWKGRDCGRAYTVSWTTSDPMFRLPRKLARQTNNSGGPKRRYIVAIRPVKSVPVRCITVDSPSALFLTGRSCIATHNTTLVRALCSELDPWERIGTVETEYELHLHELTERHKRIVPWEARPGSGERGPDGRAAGEITLDDFLYASMRFNLSRLIVGEVRGKEVLAMFKAMQTGAGSMSTTHAHSARAAVERLVTCAMEAGPHVTEQFAYRQVSEHINLIVQVALESTPGVAGAPPRRHRYITEVIHIEAGEHGRPAITDVYRPGEDGRAVPGTLPQPLAGLTRFGFDAAGFTGRAA